MTFAKEIRELIDIRRWSLLETMFALYLMVCGWKLSPIPVYLWWAVLMDIVAYKRYSFNPRRMPKNYRVLFGFIMIHQLLWVFVVSNLTSVYFNFWFSIVITMSSVFFIAPVLNYQKLKYPFIVITIISIIGLLYQLLILTRGVPIGQLTIPPFSSSRDVSDQDFEYFLRPSSFFSEPANYCEFMLVPLFLSLLDKKYIVSFIIMASMLLTTSTTGLVLSFLMLGVYFFTQKVHFRLKIIVAIGAIIIGYALTRTDVFQNTMSKVERTDLSENERTSIGFTVLPQLEFQEILLGIPYTNISDMYNDGKIKVDTFMWYDANGKAVIFVPTFWNILFLFGIFGLLIYLSVYFGLLRQSRLLLPYIIAIIAKMFSDPTAVGASFLFEICFMMAFIRWDRERRHSTLITKK